MKKKYWQIAGGVVGLLLLAVIVAPFLINVDQFRPTIQEKLSSGLGRQVRIGHMSLSLWRGQLQAADISIADDPAFSTAPFLRAKSLRVGVDVLPLIMSRALHITSLTLSEPQVTLLRSNSGTWNFSSLGQAGKGNPGAGKSANAASKAPTASARQDFSVAKLKIADGKVTVASAPNRRQTYDAVNLTAENLSYTSSFPFDLQAHTPAGGSIEVKGKAGPIDPKDVALTPFDARISMKQLDLAASGFVDPASGLAGKVDFDGTARSNGRVVHSEGTVKADKLRLVKNGSPAPQPVALEYASDYDLNRQVGQLSKGVLHTGKSAVNISGTYDTHGESPTVHMKLLAPNVPVQDIEALLPAVGVTLPAGSSLQGGTVNSRLALDGPVDRMITTGDLNLANTRLSGFSMASKLAALSAFTGVKASPDTVVQMLSSKLRIAPEGIRTDDLKLVVENLGAVTGSGTIGANNAMNFRMLAKVAGGGALGNLANLAKLGGATSGGIPFLIQGTTASPVFIPDIGGILKVGQGSSKSPDQQQKKLGDILGGILNKKKQ